MSTIYDVIIIGSGPAGLTAGMYTARAGLKTLLVAGNTWGGQLMLTSLVENFPGFPDGVMGPDLMANMRKQAEKFGAEIIDENAQNVEIAQTPFKVNSYLGRSIIVATGASFKWLGLSSEQKLIGRGVSACATCDAAFFKNKKVVVVGGGDAALEEALYLTKFASEVTIVHRRDEFRASKIMQDRVKKHVKIKVVWNAEVAEVLGEQKVEGVEIKIQDSKFKMQCDGVFVAIGHAPATKMFEGKIDLNPKMYAVREGNKYKTMSNVEGVFIAGDVHDYAYRQAITAAGYGCEAALEAEKWLEENGK